MTAKVKMKALMTLTPEQAGQTSGKGVARNQEFVCDDQTARDLELFGRAVRVEAEVGKAKP